MDRRVSLQSLAGATRSSPLVERSDLLVQSGLASPEVGEKMVHRSDRCTGYRGLRGHAYSDHGVTEPRVGVGKRRGGVGET